MTTVPLKLLDLISDHYPQFLAEGNDQAVPRPVTSAVRRAISPFAARALQARANCSTASLLGNGPVVSLTTHGRRIERVHITIESIGRGAVKPRRLIVWLDDARQVDDLPRDLACLRQRGLEILLTENRGPHTKYYPSLLLPEVHEQGLVTADDDIIYPRMWLARLTAAGEACPQDIHAYRARTIRGTTSFAPSHTWGYAKPGRSPRNFLTGVSGVWYPPTFISALSGDDRFMQLSPRADDVWLNWKAAISAHLVHQLGTGAIHFPITPQTQGVRLGATNIGEQQNDVQIRACYSRDLMSRILRSEEDAYQ